MNGTGNGGKESNSGTIGGAATAGGTVGASIAAYLNYYGQVPDILHTDTVILCVAALAAFSALVTHLMTRIDRDGDGVPDVIQDRKTAPTPTIGG